MENVNKKTTILLSAAKIFARDGFEKATIDEIIKDAKIAKGTAYYHFQSKEDIFNAVITEGINGFDLLIKKAIRKESDLIKKIEAFIDTEREYIFKYRDYFIVFIGELMKKAQRFNDLEELIEEGKSQGIIKKELDTQFVSNAIFWMVAMTTIDGQTRLQHDLILHGITAKK